MVNKFLTDNKETFYALFRIIIGLLFFMHGAQKFGWISDGSAVALMSLMGLAGIIEVVVGILVLLGLYTREAAVLGGLQMAYVFVVVHTFGQGFNIDPFSNGGEKALLFFAAFLVLATMGSGKWSLTKDKHKRR